MVQRKINLERLVDLTVGDLRHCAAEWLEVVGLGLVDEDVAVREKQNSFLYAGFPQAPDDLERRVRLASASGHDEQDTVLAARGSFDDAIDRVGLIVTRCFVAEIGVIRLRDDGRALRR